MGDRAGSGLIGRDLAPVPRAIPCGIGGRSKGSRATPVDGQQMPIAFECLDTARSWRSLRNSLPRHQRAVTAQRRSNSATSPRTERWRTSCSIVTMRRGSKLSSWGGHGALTAPSSAQSAVLININAQAKLSRRLGERSRQAEWGPGIATTSMRREIEECELSFSVFRKHATDLCALPGDKNGFRLVA